MVAQSQKVAPVKVSVIQLNSGDEVDQNLDTIERYVQQAKGEEAVAVFLPECFAFMQKSRDQLFSVAEWDGEGRIQDFLSDLSKRNKIWIFAGSLPLRTSDPSKITNSLLVYDHHGSRAARYDKIHLFDVILSKDEKYLESSYTQAGSGITVVETSFGKVGLSVCYDLRFPEMYRALVQKGAEILIVPSAFSATTGEKHWLPLLQARAIENACYVIAAAQTGVHPSGRKTHGHSVVIDPWGDVIKNQELSCGVLTADIHLGFLHRVRRDLPSLLHHRPDLF